MNTLQANNRSWLYVLALLVLVLLVYAPGLHGPFLLDDFPNFVQHPLAAIERLDLESLRNAALSNDSGPSGRPLAALSFSLNYWFAGQRFEPFWFKLTNVVIHLLNTLLVLVLVRRLLPGLLPRAQALHAHADTLALAVTAAWALHPLQLTSVLYVVQRMTSLASLCMLAGLVVYLHGRARLAAGRPGGALVALGGLAGGVALGVLFKEIALLLPLYAFVVEYAALERHTLPPLARRFINGLFAVLVAFPAAIVIGAWAARPEWLSGAFGGRPFTLVERLLTESRVLFDYVGMVVAPRPGAFGLFHDDVVVSHGLMEPPTTALALAGWALLVLMAIVSRVRGRRLLSFALGWFLVGHALESSVFPLELMHEHRNYLASLGVISGVLLLLADGLTRMTRAARPALLLVFAFAIAPAALTFARAATWGDTATLVAATLRHQPSSPRTHLLAAQYAFASGALGDAYEYSRIATRLARDDVSGLLNRLRIVERALRDPAGEALPAGTPLPESHDVPLVRDADYLAALRKALIDETGARLAQGPLSAGNRNALSRLRACIQAGAADCVPLAPVALDWYAKLYARVDLPPSARSMMAADHARVLAALGRDREALDWLRRSWQMTGDDLQVLVLEAVLELRLGEVEAAAATADRLGELRRQVGFDSRQFDALREAIERARGGAGSPPDAATGGIT